MKVSKKDFEQFKKECTRLQKEWGLMGWEINYLFKKLDGNYAQTDVDFFAHKATLSLTTEYADDAIDEHNILNHAKHEMLHVLLWRLTTLGEQRYVRQEEFNEAEHEVIQHLLNIL